MIRTMQQKDCPKRARSPGIFSLFWVQASTWSSTGADVLKFDSAEDAVVFLTTESRQR